MEDIAATRVVGVGAWCGLRRQGGAEMGPSPLLGKMPLIAASQRRDACRNCSAVNEGKAPFHQRGTMASVRIPNVLRVSGHSPCSAPGPTPAASNALHASPYIADDVQALCDSACHSIITCARQSAGRLSDRKPSLPRLSPVLPSLRRLHMTVSLMQ